MLHAQKIIRITGAILILFLFAQFLGAATGQTASRRIVLETREDNTAKLTVELEGNASIILYYDNQMPTSTTQLDQFWYALDSKTQTNVHVFELEELHPEEPYYFRIEQTFPKRHIGALRQWKIDNAAEQQIIIYENGSEL